MRPKAAIETETVVIGDWQHVGEQIVACVGVRDFEGLAEYFRPQVICRLLIPSGLVTSFHVSTLVGYFRQWFGNADHFVIQGSQITQVGNRLHIVYRIRLRQGGLWYLIEQQAYGHLDTEDGRIARFDLLCSGFRLDHRAS
jgi:hypothetical protein